MCKERISAKIFCISRFNYEEIHLKATVITKQEKEQSNWGIAPFTMMKRHHSDFHFSLIYIKVSFIQLSLIYKIRAYY